MGWDLLVRVTPPTTAPSVPVTPVTAELTGPLDSSFLESSLPMAGDFLGVSEVVAM